MPLDHRSFRFRLNQSMTTIADSLALVCSSGLQSWLVHTPLTWSILTWGEHAPTLPCHHRRLHHHRHPSLWTKLPLPPDLRSFRFRFWLSQSMAAIADSLALACSSGFRSWLVPTPLTWSKTDLGCICSNPPTLAPSRLSSKPSPPLLTHWPWQTADISYHPTSHKSDLRL